MEQGQNGGTGCRQDLLGPEHPLDGARILTTADYRRAVFARLLDRLIERFEAERGFAIFATEAGELDLKKDHNLSVGDSREPVISHTIVEDVAAKRRAVLIEDAMADPVLREHTSVVGRGIRSVMCVPMVAGEELVGVIYVDNLSEGGKFSPADLEMLTLTASYAAAALWARRLLGRTEQLPVRGAAESPARHDDAARADNLSAMAAVLAHDFNNVLAAIEGRLQLVQQQSPAACEGKLAHNIAKAQEAVETGKGLIGQIANYAAIVRGGEPIEIDLAQLVREVAELMSYRLEEGKAHYELQMSLPEQMRVKQDPTQIKEVLLNLFSNALDAMPDGGRLSVSLRAEGSSCVLEVADTGCGIPQELQGRLFEPFFSTKGGKGMGLGLSMVKPLVTREGGRIEVESAPGQGAVFRIYLPLNPPEGRSAESTSIGTGN